MSLKWKPNEAFGTLDADTGFSDYTLWVDGAPTKGRFSYGLSTFEVNPTWGDEATLADAKVAAVSCWRNKLRSALDKLEHAQPEEPRP